MSSAAEGANQNFFKLRPKILPCKYHTSGLKLIVENEQTHENHVLPMERKAIIDHLDGKKSIREIMEKVYQESKSLPFKSLYSTIKTLNDAKLLDPPLNTAELATDENPYDKQEKGLMQSFYQKSLFQRVDVPFQNVKLFYTLGAVVLLSILTFSINFLPNLQYSSFLNLQEGYSMGVFLLFVGSCILLSFRYFLKCLLLGLGVGHFFNPGVKWHWAGIYFHVSDESIYSMSDKNKIIFYAINSSLFYLFGVAILTLIIKDPAYIHSMAILAIILTFFALNPYKKSEMTRVFSFFFNDEQMTDLIPYLRNRALLSILDRKKEIDKEYLYLLYASCSLLWAIAFTLFFLDLISGNLPTLIKSIRYDVWTESLGASVILFFLVYVCFSLMVDLFSTIFNNFIYPFIGPMLKARQMVFSKKKKVDDVPAMENFLSKTHIFDGVNPDSVRSLIKNSMLTSFKKGTRIIIQGDPGHEMYFLLNGVVEILRREPTGKERKIGNLYQGAIFGEIAILKDCVRTADVVASEDVDVLVITKEEIHTLLGGGENKEDYKKIMDRIALVNYLSSSRLFLGMPHELIHAVLSKGIVEHKPANYIVTKQGDDDKTFYLLVRGEVSIKRDGKLIATLKQGDYFGEIALIANQKRTATVETLMDCMLLKLEADAFWDVLTENVNLAMCVEAMAEERIAGAS